MAAIASKKIKIPETEEMIIAGLQPETAYSITVAAYTMKGDGARSKPKVVTTKGADVILSSSADYSNICDKN
ncbi:hypothetical protein IHE44_0010065 [Lamprotornis superbus]|uniref:Fibronectin type-III domain-containing protein n=1 Tax=Lamprotornis superbus TaxID=245042 RepID=A0A835NI29_9PASS|nr:hypothetical protein IHE44_0010065 [Lamprotornis superbus]